MFNQYLLILTLLSFFLKTNFITIYKSTLALSDHRTRLNSFVLHPKLKIKFIYSLFNSNLSTFFILVDCVLYMCLYVLPISSFVYLFTHFVHYISEMSWFDLI